MASLKVEIFREWFKSLGLEIADYCKQPDDPVVYSIRSHKVEVKIMVIDHKIDITRYKMDTPWLPVRTSLYDPNCFDIIKRVLVEEELIEEDETPIGLIDEWPK
jgi:hypothetical protein